MVEREPPKLTIEPLGQQHNRAAFSCGEAALDLYLQKQAGQDARKRASVTYVATEDRKTIAGYYTLSQYAVELEDIPEDIAKKLPKYPTVPASLLGRLARSLAFRGRDIGPMLLMDALRRCLEASKGLASTGVVVDAKNEKANKFYRQFGFLDLPNVKGHLFLPMGTIETMFEVKG
ncbi:MAG: N-acetyltransferase [Acidobacteriaceae bacterium]|nr:N-acetyltransferase [Acidobacteriaceae bacterium]